MIDLERDGAGAVDRLMSSLDATQVIGQARALAEDRGFTWNQGQVEATRGILTTSSRVIGLQGYAGAAKTMTVLATVAEAARQFGYTVKGMAPRTKATQVLADAIGGEAVTTQRHVAVLRDPGRDKTRTKSSRSSMRPRSSAPSTWWPFSRVPSARTGACCWWVTSSNSAASKPAGPSGSFRSTG